jgi:hypothetical protein
MRHSTISSFGASFVKWFITLMPLYYAPFLFIPDVHGDEWAALRNGKDYIILLVLVIWFFYFLVNELRSALNSATSTFVLLYMIYGLLIIPSLDDFERIIEISRIYILYPIWFFVARSLYTSRPEVQTQLNRWVLVSIIVSIIGISEFLFFGGNNVYSRAAGQARSISTLFNPNALGWYLVAMNALLLGMIRFGSINTNEPRGSYSYSTALLILIINTMAIVMSGSRSALLINVFIISLWLLSMVYKTKVATTVAISCFLVALSYFAMPSETDVPELRSFGGMETSRFEIYSEMLKSFWGMDFINILFGLDASAYSVLKQSGLLDDSYVLTVVASGGIVSILIFTSIVVTGFVKNLSRRKYLSHERASMFHLLSACFILGFIGNLQGIFPLAIIFWVAFGLLMQMITRRI